MSADFGIGKEVRDALVLAIGGIAICVFIGSMIAQSLSHGPGHGDATQEAPAAEAPAEKAH